ncbi:BQ5605_C013g07072 [Microbotryum silenes-dioicae]|uniref:BQ5605_C013g07072 protein n=1 Tax=Microbotryum silenes-dioicae TaxID=796604 RepID=A0A2X0LQU5_9BASI|nr:BQ5605_C013g07072 [Microbotryum silenes-dioicae]
MVRSFALVKIYGMAREGRSLVSGQYPRVKARLVSLYWIAFLSAPTAQQPALEIQPREDIRRCRGDEWLGLGCGLLVPGDLYLRLRPPTLTPRRSQPTRRIAIYEPQSKKQKMRYILVQCSWANRLLSASTLFDAPCSDHRPVVATFALPTSNADAEPPLSLPSTSDFISRLNPTVFDDQDFVASIPGVVDEVYRRLEGTAPLGDVYDAALRAVAVLL